MKRFDCVKKDIDEAPANITFSLNVLQKKCQTLSELGVEREEILTCLVNIVGHILQSISPKETKKEVINIVNNVLESMINEDESETENECEK